MPELLEQFGLSPSVKKEVLHTVWGDDNPDAASPDIALSKWLQLLPAEISQQTDIALKQQRPFMPPDITPEMMAKSNATVPSMNHIEIIYRCINFALVAGDYSTAAALIYVVDRACYRFGRSTPLLGVVDDIMKVSPQTAIAPQVILRKARVMKDSGDLHGAMRILEAVVSRERQWDYKDQAQYENTKAVCVQIKGQILHNLGLWKEAVAPLIESIKSFHVVSDHKGISSSLGLLARCLNKLGAQEYTELRSSSPEMFHHDHPCYEAYRKGLEAVEHMDMDNLASSLYASKHQMVADESLLMYTIQTLAESTKHRMFQTIMVEMKKSLAGHRTVHFLNSVEAFFEFVRAVFMISLTLTFSPVPQDTDLARFLETLSMKLYAFMCLRPGESEQSASLTQNKHSVRLMNGALALLGLPLLEGSVETEQNEADPNWENVAKAEDTATESKSASFPSDKAATFPATSLSKQMNEKGERKFVHRKYIGLPVSKGDILSATCPAAVSENVALGTSGDDGSDGGGVSDVDRLMPSAKSIASVSSSLRASGATTSLSDTVDLSATTKSTSSDTNESFALVDGKKIGSTGSSFEILSSKSSSSSHDHFVQIGSGTGGSDHSFTVDLSVSTRASASGTSESSDPVFENKSLPLVDLSASELCGKMVELNLGDSVATSDSGEFLANWTPADDQSVHRAVLWTYNPVTGQWSAQTTLAHIGAQLQAERKGTLRDAFHVSFLHQDEPLGRYVGKRYRRQRKPDVYMQDVVCQMLAGYYVTRFNQALQHCTEDILQVQFLSAAHLQLCDSGGEVVDWINVEPFLHGSFLKLTNNFKFVSQDAKDELGVEVATALSHFSYMETGGMLMLVDLQGWMPSDGRGVVYLTDPVFHTQYIKKFSSCDHQQKGMDAFWEKQHPTCNRICSYLALDKFRPDKSGK